MRYVMGSMVMATLLLGGSAAVGDDANVGIVTGDAVAAQRVAGTDDGGPVQQGTVGTPLGQQLRLRRESRDCCPGGPVVGPRNRGRSESGGNPDRPARVRPARFSAQAGACPRAAAGCPGGCARIGSARGYRHRGR